MPVTIETITENLSLGEGPHWDVETQTLYFVDIFGGSVHKYKPSTKEHAKAKIGESVSFIIPIESAKNKFVVTTQNEVKVITWDGVSDKAQGIEKIAEVDAVREGGLFRFNDGKADKLGRLWLGNYAIDAKKIGNPDLGDFLSKRGSLYTLSQEKKLIKWLDGISLSNGLDWNNQFDKFYYIDSFEKKIFQFDYNLTNGTISNQEAIFTLEKHNIEGIPDGLTIDAEGNLWIAIFGASRVIKIDPRKPETLLQTIEFPAKQITSVAFGGPNLDELYVTSGRITPETATEDDGNTFVVKGLGVKGLPGRKVKL